MEYIIEVLNELNLAEKRKLNELIEMRWEELPQSLKDRLVN